MRNERNQGLRTGQHQRSQRGGEPSGPQVNSRIPTDYPSYFKNDKLDPNYLDDYARRLATDFGNSRPRLTKSQMRGFFGDVKRVQTRFRAAGEDFDIARERLLQLKALAYERFRKNKVPAEFQRFIERNIDKIVDGRTFTAFVKHFEAVVAYSEGKLD